MATSITYVVFTQNKKKDGSIPVKIRLTHNRKTKYFPTAVSVTKDQLDRKGTKIKDVRITEVLDDMIRQYRYALAAIDNAQYLDADEVADIIKASMKREKGFRLDFFEYAEGKIAGMKPKTAETYRTAMNALKRFVGGDRLDISRINFAFITGFKAFLETEPPVKANNNNTYKAKKAGCRAVSLYLSNVRAIYNKAIDEFNDDYYTPIRNLPFKRSTIPPQPKTETRALEPEQIRGIASFRDKDPLVEAARDFFLLSFMLAGINTIDLFNALKSDVRDGVLHYKRTKTASRRSDNAEAEIRVEPEAAAIIARHTDEGRWLLAVHREGGRRHGSYTNAKEFNRSINEHLKKIMPGLTTYHARHSWATIARNGCGVPRDVVAEGLVHASDDKVTEIYLKKDYSRVWEANRKVLDLVFGKNF